jgi:hypothetical protein
MSQVMHASLMSNNLLARAYLHLMRLLQLEDNGDFSLIEHFDRNIPQYRILHTLGQQIMKKSSLKA